MKTLVEILGTVFLTVGSVVGAGFISGRELISFFGADNFAVYLLLSGALFLICFYLVFRCSRKYACLNEFNGKLLKNPKLFDVAVKISCFISSAVMLSAIDEFTKPISPFGFPIYSILTLIALTFLAKYGVKGAKITSLFIMPIVVIGVNVIIALNGDLSFPSLTSVTTKNLGKTLLYVSLNVFMNLPSLVDGARGKSKKSLLIIATLSAIILCVQGGLILGTINGVIGAENYPLPLLASVGNGNKTVFSTLCLTAIFTSLSTAYYPLGSFAESKSKRFGKLTLALACFLTARLGVKNIIDYAYPVIGGFGVVYIFYCVIFIVKQKRYKNCKVAKNGNIYAIWRCKMSKKKKNKVVKLTDEQYNDYIMSLKDETPPKLVRDALDDKN